jgi:hypothetical protein
VVVARDDQVGVTGDGAFKDAMDAARERSFSWAMISASDHVRSFLRTSANSRMRGGDVKSR